MLWVLPEGRARGLGIRKQEDMCQGTSDKQGPPGIAGGGARGSTQEQMRRCHLGEPGAEGKMGGGVHPLGEKGWQWAVGQHGAHGWRKGKGKWGV